MGDGLQLESPSKKVGSECNRGGDGASTPGFDEVPPDSSGCREDQRIEVRELPEAGVRGDQTTAAGAGEGGEVGFPRRRFAFGRPTYGSRGPGGFAMNVYTFSQARQNFASVLDEAQSRGGVRIRRRDGSEFEIAPIRSTASPLDVRGVELNLSANEIVAAVREGRER
jgi:hypothetical protein